MRQNPLAAAVLLSLWLAWAVFSYFYEGEIGQTADSKPYTKETSADFFAQTSSDIKIDEATSSDGGEKSDEKLRVCTWNLKNYSIARRKVGGQWREYPKLESEKSAIAKTLSEINADIVLVQEVGDETFLKDLRDNLARVGQIYPYCATTAYDSPSRVAILSKVKPVKFYDFSDTRFQFGQDMRYSPRGAIGGEFKLGQARIKVFSIHLKSKQGARKSDEHFAPFRAGEIRAIASRIDDDAGGIENVVIGGDFNEDPSGLLLKVIDSVGLRVLTGSDLSGRPYSYYWTKGDKYYIYDYFLVGKEIGRKNISSVKIVHSPEGSDHSAVYADFNFSAASSN